MQVLDSDDALDRAVVYSLPAIVKARAVDGRRLIEVEASVEREDLEGDLITQKAILESADSFVRGGHIDIDHYSELGFRLGISDPSRWIFGRPVEVKALADGRTSVIADVSGAPERIHDHVQSRDVTLWADLTADPPIPWFASVYGFPLPGGTVDCSRGRCGPEGPSRLLITKFDWRSLALTRRPVNAALIGNARVVMAKSFVAALLAAKAAEPGTRGNPVVVRCPADLAVAARQVGEPTVAQAAAGNYGKGHVVVGGLDITIETPMGALRTGVSRDGQQWSVRMPVDYGYVKRTKGADGDHVDVYLGPDSYRAADLPVLVIDQIDPDAGGKFDEHKVMVGFADRDLALRAYRAAFSDGRGDERIGAMTGIPFVEFGTWLATGSQGVPFAPLVLPTDKAIPPSALLPGSMEELWAVRECAKCGVHDVPSLPGYRWHFAKCAGMPSGTADVAAHAVMHRLNMRGRAI